MTKKNFVDREVVVVDSNDNELGMMDIWEAHKNPGVLHRAISVVLTNSKGEWLLQKRSEQKPLWPGFWSNTVCTHPQKGEGYGECGVRRLREEMGISLKIEDLKVWSRFVYQAHYNHELSEHEVDTVLVGKYEGEVGPDKDEVSEWKWVPFGWLENDLRENGDQYTPWFKLIVSLFNKNA